MQAGPETRIQAELFMTWRRRKNVVHNLNVYVKCAFDLVTKALLVCLFEHRGLNSEPADCSKTSVLTMHDKSH